MRSNADTLRGISSAAARASGIATACSLRCALQTALVHFGGGGPPMHIVPRQVSVDVIVRAAWVHTRQPTSVRGHRRQDRSQPDRASPQPLAFVIALLWSGSSNMTHRAHTDESGDQPAEDASELFGTPPSATRGNRPAHTPFNDTDARPGPHATEAHDPGETPVSLVTALRTDRRDPHRMVVFINRVRAGSMPATVVRDEMRLEVGSVLTPEQVDAIHRHDAVAEAKRLALNMLDRRALSRGELINRLVYRRRVARDVAESTANALVDAGLINDLEYGRSVLRTLTTSRPAGPALMRQRLQARRLDRGVIDQLVDEFAEAGDQTEALERLVRGKLRAMNGLEPEVMRRRLYGMLARRGFNSETAMEVVRRFVSD